jgi:hypothetical protein
MQIKKKRRYRGSPANIPIHPLVRHTLTYPTIKQLLKVEQMDGLPLMGSSREVTTGYLRKLTSQNEDKLLTHQM